jgi:hypothetical protein
MTDNEFTEGKKFYILSPADRCGSENVLYNLGMRSECSSRGNRYPDRWYRGLFGRWLSDGIAQRCYENQIMIVPVDPTTNQEDADYLPEPEYPPQGQTDDEIRKGIAERFKAEAFIAVLNTKGYELKPGGNMLLQLQAALKQPRRKFIHPFEIIEIPLTLFEKLVEEGEYPLIKVGEGTNGLPQRRYSLEEIARDEGWEAPEIPAPIDAESHNSETIYRQRVDHLIDGLGEMLLKLDDFNSRLSSLEMGGGRKPPKTPRLQTPKQKPKKGKK